MSGPHLNLLVVYSPDVDRAKAFYELLGLRFQREQHGRGPVHFAAPLGELVLEIYPLSDGAVAGQLRLGFDVRNIEPLLETLLAAGGKLVSEIQDLPRGRVAVIADPDGRKLELVEPRGRQHCCG